MANFDDILLDDDKQVSNREVKETKEDVTPLDGVQDKDDLGNVDVTDNVTPPVEDKKTDVVESPYDEGTEIETPDGTVYTIKDGNLVDKDGNVFKEAKDVKSFIESFDDEGDEDSTFNLAAVQKLLGEEIKDENGKPVEYTDDAEGRKAYVKQVMELKRQEAEVVALNTFFQNNPIVKNFVDYIMVNNGDYRGFGETPDRTGIEFAPDNAEQHKAIVRAAWSEFGKRGDVEKYIKYLEDSGALADTAREDLEAIKEKDKAYKENLTRQAEEARRQEEAELNAYWNAVYKAIDSRIIGGYKIPEALTVERNGQKVNLTPNDFFAFVSRVDRNTGRTGYQNALANLSEEDQINRELLDAWLHFTGGSYKDLVDMAVKENEVKRLKLVAKTAKKPSGAIKINKPSGAKVNRSDIILS